MCVWWGVCVVQVLLEQTTVIEKDLNEAIAWREAAEAKMAELGEYADTHEALSAQVPCLPSTPAHPPSDALAWAKVRARVWVNS